MSEMRELKGERAFLHDIASPISAVHLNLSGVLEECEEKSLLTPELLEVLKDALKCTDRVISMLRDRREELIAAGVPSDRGSK